ncbi:hypothetical protein GUJ93_ZPchr0001g29263 [Zizania palustris]|uniref:3'-5' exonuclease domain-containing protein n=1 Tax=Zizania palustris TaxID=103762 RepID=A0A8J5RZF3_ZIZPA|nr:hypothetical protein GUJ93_ZPchr0001g29263 [Zizania palustris]
MEDGRHTCKYDDIYHTDVTMEDGTVIRTTITSLAHHVTLFIKEVTRDYEGHDQQQLIVGIDTEWRRCFHADGRQFYRTAVLQLCVGYRCLVFQIIHADYIPFELMYFLADPDICFVGVGIDGDIKRLDEDCNLKIANSKDLRSVAADVLCRPELQHAGLKRLTLEVMGVNIDKPKHITMSKWFTKPLSREQVRYACIDAYVSFEIGRRLLSGESTRHPTTSTDVIDTVTRASSSSSSIS